MMKKIIPLFTTLLLLGWSMNAWSFACKTATGATIPIGGGSANAPASPSSTGAELSPRNHQFADRIPLRWGCCAAFQSAEMLIFSSNRKAVTHFTD